MTTKKHKRKFSMPTAFTILFFIILFIVVVSWILNGIGITYDIEVDDGSGNLITENVAIQAAGILDVFWSIIQGFVERAEVIVFVLALGGFIAVVMNTKALDAMTQSLAKKFNTKAIWIIPILMLFFSFCGSTYGMAEETLGFYMIVIPLMLSTGFDKMTGLFIVLFGAGTGVLASTVNPFVIAVAEDASGGLIQGEGMAWRWISWVVFTLVGIVIVMLYANKVRKNPKKSVVFKTYEEDKIFFLGEEQTHYKFTWRRIVTLVFFFITFLIMVVYLVDWDSIISGSDAAGAGEWFNNNIPWITANIPGFGQGYLVEIGAFFLISALLIAAFNWTGEANFVNSFIDGSRDLLGVCMIIATAAGVGVILDRTLMNDWIIISLSKSLGTLNATAFVLISFLIFLPLSFLIPSTSGFAAAIFPIWGPLAVTAGAGSGTILAFSFASGILNLFTPTSGVVMGALGIARVDYGKFWKAGGIYIGSMTVLSIAMLAIGSLLPAGSIF